MCSDADHPDSGKRGEPIAWAVETRIPEDDWRVDEVSVSRKRAMDTTDLYGRGIEHRVVPLFKRGPGLRTGAGERIIGDWTTAHEETHPTFLVRLDDYQISNLLWALGEIAEGDHQELNTGDWVGEVSLKLADAPESTRRDDLLARHGEEINNPWADHPDPSTGGREYVTVSLDTLEAVWNALDRALGDTDADWYESEEELRRDDPLLWAAQKIGVLIRSDSSTRSEGGGTEPWNRNWPRLRAVFDRIFPTVEAYVSGDIGDIEFAGQMEEHFDPAPTGSEDEEYLPNPYGYVMSDDHYEPGYGSEVKPEREAWDAPVYTHHQMIELARRLRSTSEGGRERVNRKLNEELNCGSGWGARAVELALAEHDIGFDPPGDVDVVGEALERIILAALDGRE